MTVIIQSNESNRLHSAWLHAAAELQLALHAPGNEGADLPEELDKSLGDAEHAALLAFLLHPASTAPELSRKLRVFRDADAYCCPEAAELVAQLAEDARRLAFTPSAARPGVPLARVVREAVA